MKCSFRKGPISVCYKEAAVRVQNGKGSILGCFCEEHAEHFRKACEELGEGIPGILSIFSVKPLPAGDVEDAHLNTVSVFLLTPPTAAWKQAEDGVDRTALLGWWLVEDEEGTIAYFKHKDDALAYRLMLVNFRMHFNVGARYAPPGS